MMIVWAPTFPSAPGATAVTVTLTGSALSVTASSVVKVMLDRL